MEKSNKKNEFVAFQKSLPSKPSFDKEVNGKMSIFQCLTLKRSGLRSGWVVEELDRNCMGLGSWNRMVGIVCLKQ